MTERPLFAFPFLSPAILESRHAELKAGGYTWEELIENLQSASTGSPLDPERGTHRATGLQLISVEQLEGIQSAIRAIAREHGFPKARPGTSGTTFDRECAEFLVEELPICDADASTKDVWCHFNGYLLADVVCWRWDGLSDDRFGLSGRWKVRNQFGRLWWMGELFGPAYWKNEIGADQALQLLERPTVGGYPPLARAVAAAWVKRTPDVANIPEAGEKLLRQSVMNIRRRRATMPVYSLGDEQLTDLVSRSFDVEVDRIIAEASN